MEIWLHNRCTTGARPSKVQKRLFGQAVPHLLAPRQGLVQRPQAGAGARGLPSTLGEVAAWAEAEWVRQVEAGVPSLPKACLLLALEEEAVLQQAYQQAERLDGALSRHVGAPSTWSLERLDSLAAEAASGFYRACQALGVHEAVALASAGTAPDSILWTLHLDLVRSYPTHLLSAVNDVLFLRHGYQRQAAHGNPRDSRLSAVLEGGQGSPGTLAVIYMEICARLGLPLHAFPLEEGRHFILWPVDPTVPLSAGGERVVIDPLRGNLITAEEVLELFGVESLRPASNAQLLAAMLAVVRDAYWCRAVGCPAEPGLMVPLSAELALPQPEEEAAAAAANPSSSAQRQKSRQWRRWRQPQRGPALGLALAAARKRAVLLPCNPQAQLHLALLLFFSGQHSEAWQELGCLLQGEAAGAFSEGQRAQLRVLLEKLRLLAEFGNES